MFLNKRSRETETSNRAWRELRRALLFAHLLFVLYLLFAYLILISKWGNAFLLLPMNDLTARATALLLAVFGVCAGGSGAEITTAFGDVVVYEGCNGVYATAVFTAGVIACPTNWWKRLIGVALMSAGIFVVNILRVVTLLYVSKNHKEMFGLVHDYLWQVVLIAVGALIWLVWYERVAQENADPPNT